VLPRRRSSAALLLYRRRSSLSIGIEQEITASLIRRASQTSLPSELISSGVSSVYETLPEHDISVSSVSKKLSQCSTSPIPRNQDDDSSSSDGECLADSDCPKTATEDSVPGSGNPVFKLRRTGARYYRRQESTPILSPASSEPAERNRRITYDIAMGVISPAEWQSLIEERERETATSKSNYLIYMSVLCVFTRFQPDADKKFQTPSREQRGAIKKCQAFRTYWSCPLFNILRV